LKLKGRVFRGSSGNYWIHVRGNDHPYVARLRGTLKKELVYSESASHARRVISAKKRRVTDPVTVGDLVVFDSDTLVIEEVQPRTSEMARKSPTTGEQHVLVANLDTLIICLAAAHPEPNLWMLDRFIVVAENQEIGIEIVVNKLDIFHDQAALELLFEPYRLAGYDICYTSAKDGTGVDDFRNRLAGRITALTGNSGVGKSSLINAVQPGLTLRTGDIGLTNRKGRHTTTQAELVRLFDDSDTWLADTPGLRQLDFWEVDETEVEYGFIELRDLAPDCQFGNCTHRSEPGCAVREAVRSHKIDTRRWESYKQLYEEAISGRPWTPGAGEL
jgi:ribosome biogenesis GTPase